jgi:hypothetical protein
MRGRCENGAEGGKNMDASSAGLVKTHAGAWVQEMLRSSGIDSDLMMSGVGVVAMGVEAVEWVLAAELEVEAAEGESRPPVVSIDDEVGVVEDCIGGGGGGHCGGGGGGASVGCGGY